jgi:hypothetical protein
MKEAIRLYCGVHRISALSTVAAAAILTVFAGCAAVQQGAGAGSDGAAEGPPRVALEPEAEARFDDSYRGIYKGVLTSADGSGMFELNIENSGPSDIILRGSYNGEAFSLQGEERYDPQDEEYSYSFDGTSAGEEISISFRTSVSVSGEIDRRNTSFTAGGEAAHVNIMKESSDSMVKVFEGRYRGESTGTWNYILKDGEVSGYYAGDGEGEFEGRREEQKGRLLVWGVDGNLIARGSIAEDGETEGLWRYVEGGGFSAGTPTDDYPSADGTENSWSGERSL